LQFQLESSVKPLPPGFVNSNVLSHFSEDVLREHRERLASQEFERLERKRIQREELCSDLRTADERIRAWEQLHGLRLPVSAKHAIIDVIVADTRLTLAEVVAEQQARAARSAQRRAAAAAPTTVAT
jgi:hypothetical protein